MFPPLVIWEDDHLLVVDKPPGINTHAPSELASDGLYEWLRRRETRWSSLSILQRLDRETSGVMLFGKTREANRELGAQFEQRRVRKSYLLLTDRDPGPASRRICSSGPGGPEHAETEFRPLGRERGRWLVEALPRTGRTHQVRLHARDAGFPILGDTAYGGSRFGRLCLHARTLEIVHPATGAPLAFSAAVDFDADPHIQLCSTLWPEPGFDAWRLVHGASSGEPGWYVDRLGPYLLSQSEREPADRQLARLEAWQRSLGARGVYHKTLSGSARAAAPREASPVLLSGEPAPPRFEVRENGVRFAMSFEEGYSQGLFLDQRENRRRVLLGQAFPPTRGDSLQVLNAFAYTCAFSVCAALAGAYVTSLDLSRKTLDWGRDNFALNGLDPGRHDFIYGDCFDWMKRLAKKDRRFDLVLLDPPTFSRSKQSGVFRVERDYPRLVELALPLLAPGGMLLCSTNCASLAADDFVRAVTTAIHAGGRAIAERELVTQPPDFATSREEPGYLKALWLAVA